MNNVLGALFGVAAIVAVILGGAFLLRAQDMGSLVCDNACRDEQWAVRKFEAKERIERERLRFADRERERLARLAQERARRQPRDNTHVVYVRPAPVYTGQRYANPHLGVYTRPIISVTPRGYPPAGWHPVGRGTSPGWYPVGRVH